MYYKTYFYGLLILHSVLIGPHPEWDPDVVAALDGDFDENDPENTLEDDFFIKVLWLIH